MIKRGIVFIILLSFLFPLLLSCSSSSENSSSGGVQHIYEDSSDNAVQVSGIKIAGNYIELVKEAGVDLQYNISAVVQPENAENKTAIYFQQSRDCRSFIRWLCNHKRFWHI